MTISFGDISCVRAKDVGMSDLAVGPSRAHDDFTDGGISRGATGQNRELVAWAPEEGDLAPAMTLEEEAAAGQGAKRASGATWGKKSGQWDQFSANKELFGVDTKFDESLYTTKLEKGKMGITEAEAARIAYEIQNQVSDNPHGGGARTKSQRRCDEEERYSSVLPSKPSAPKASAWGTGKIPSSVAQHADKKPEEPKKEEKPVARRNPSSTRTPLLSLSTRKQPRSCRRLRNRQRLKCRSQRLRWSCIRAIRRHRAK